MELLKLAVLCAVCVLPVSLLRKKTPEQALLLTAAVLAAVLAGCLAAAAPLVETLRALSERAGIEGTYLGILLRVTAAALVTRFCADLCKDGGAQALASAVETAGSVAAFAIALPLLQAVVEMILGFF